MFDEVKMISRLCNDFCQLARQSAYKQSQEMLKITHEKTFDKLLVTRKRALQLDATTASSSCGRPCHYQFPSRPAVHLFRISAMPAANEQTDTALGLYAYRYHILTGVYAIMTGGAFLRIGRQPYSRAVKWEQYETVFKGTTLLAALAGLGLSGNITDEGAVKLAEH